MRFMTILLICLLLLISLSSAANITTNITPNQTIAQNITINKYPPEEFYGNVTYSDGSPIPIGGQIKAVNQYGKIMGTFNITVNGSYGDDYKSASRLLVYAENMSDEITFYVNNIKSTVPPRKFDSSTIKRADIALPLSAKISLTPTINPTPALTPTINQTPIIQNITTVATPVPTQIPTQIVTTPTQTPIPTIIKPTTPVPTQYINETTMKFLGVLLIAIAVCAFGAVITYFILTRKMKREDEEEIIL